jgi:hypothetical protein
MPPSCVGLPVCAMADLTLPTKRVPARDGSDAAPPVKRQIHGQGQAPKDESVPMEAEASQQALPAGGPSSSGAAPSQDELIRQLQVEVSQLKLERSAKEKTEKAAGKGGKGKEGKSKSGTPKAKAKASGGGAGAVDLGALQTLAVSTARLALAEAHQGRQHRAIVAEGVLIPRDTPLVQAIKDRTKELAEARAGLETQQEKDALGEPHCYAWNALMIEMLKLARDKGESAAEATLSSFVSTHLDPLTSLQEKIRVISQQISHCWVARAHKKGDQMLAKLHVGAIMTSDAKACWTCMKDMLVKHCNARVLAGTAPRGHQERQVQLHLNSMGQSSPWTDW